MIPMGLQSSKGKAFDFYQILLDITRKVSLKPFKIFYFRLCKKPRNKFSKWWFLSATKRFEWVHSYAIIKIYTFPQSVEKGKGNFDEEAQKKVFCFHARIADITNNNNNFWCAWERTEPRERERKRNGD